MGEYSVIQGGNALLAAVKPGFSYVRSTGFVFHQESPVAKFLKDRPLDFSISSTGLGAGFGSSTAELVAAACFLENRFPESTSLWNWYRTIHPEASGADLVVQMDALAKGRALFKYGVGETTACEPTPILEHIHVFSVPSDRKILTHEALKRERKSLDLSRANAWVEELRNTLESDDVSRLDVLSDWADWLKQLGLESAFASEVRYAFQRCPNVAGVKGCGAGLNDVFLVAVHQNELDSRISDLALRFGLKDLGPLSDLMWSPVT